MTGKNKGKPDMADDVVCILHGSRSWGKPAMIIVMELETVWNG